MTLRDILTQERIAQAFEKTVQQVEIPYGKLVLITEEYYEGVKEFFDKSLLKDEVTCIALNVGMAPTMIELFDETVKQHMSLMIVDPKSNDIMGIRIMGVASKDDTHGANEADDDGMKSLLALWNYSDERADIFNRYNTNEVINFFGLSVGRQYRQKGVGAKLMEAALCMIRSFDVSPIYIKGGASSSYSDKIYQKLAFELLDEFLYKDYVVDGKVVIQHTGVHKAFKAYGKVL